MSQSSSSSSSLATSPTVFCSIPTMMAKFASQTYTEIEASAPASPPLGFPAPITFPAERITVQCWDPEMNVYVSKEVLRRRCQEQGQPSQTAAYLLPGILLRATLCGQVVVATVLELSENASTTTTTNNDADDCYYRPTGQKVAIKMDLRSTIRELHDTGHHPHPENPWKEVAAMQLLAHEENNNNNQQGNIVIGEHSSNSHHENVNYLVDALRDETCLYEVMPYYNGGSLYQQCCTQGHAAGLPEPQARHYFRQILAALYHLHAHGVCHRDVSTHNIMLVVQDKEEHDNNNNNNNSGDHDYRKDRCVLIDFGMAVRIPYSYPDDHHTEEVTDISIVGTSGAATTMTATTTTMPLRRLIHSESHCGKLRFMAPKMFNLAYAVDSLAVDLWSAAVILFVMLTGRHPYEKPCARSDAGYRDLMDRSYYWDPKGFDQVFSWGHAVSAPAVDLLHGMFRPHPKERLTLAQVIAHPWVVNGDSSDFGGVRGNPLDNE